MRTSQGCASVLAHQGCACAPVLVAPGHHEGVDGEEDAQQPYAEAVVLQPTQRGEAAPRG